MDLKNLTEFFTMKDEAIVKKYFGGERYKLAKNGVYLMAHTDTVFKRPPKKSEIMVKNGVYTAPKIGLGADNRAGCFIVHYLMKKIPDCGYLLSPDEESGDKIFLKEVPKFDAPKLFLSFDQSGDSNYINYDWRSEEIERFLNGLGFARWTTMTTSCVFMSKKYNVPCVNMCMGANNFHDTNEYLDSNVMIRLVPTYEKLIEFCVQTELNLYDGGKCKELFEQGKKYAGEKKYDRAIELYTEALTLAKDGAEKGEILTYRAYAYRWDKYAKKAIADFTAALKYLPEYSDAYIGRGDVYNFTDKKEKAIADYTTALSLGIDKHIVFTNRGNVYCYQYDDKYDLAIADYTAAIELDPNNLDALRDRARSYYFIENYDKAIADCAVVLEHYPKDNRALYWRGISYVKLEDFNKAVADFKKMLQFAEGDYEASLAKENLEKVVAKCEKQKS